MSEEKGCHVFESALTQNGTSELGLKSHWEGVFSQDLSLWNQDISSENCFPTVSTYDEGECDDDTDERQFGGHCWFGAFVSNKMVDFILPYCLSTDDNEEEQDNAQQKQKNLLTILDIGTGNGDLLFRLAKKLLSDANIGRQCEINFFGMDYCQDAITLAKSIAQKRMATGANVEWVVDDALRIKNLPLSSMDILLDKVCSYISTCDLIYCSIFLLSDYCAVA
jgi:SAM-dependent methyltransferase